MGEVGQMTYYRIIWKDGQPVVDSGIVNYVGKKTKQRRIKSRRMGDVPSGKAWRPTIDDAVHFEMFFTCCRVSMRYKGLPLLEAVERICQLKRLQSKLEKHGLIQ